MIFAALSETHVHRVVAGEPRVEFVDILAIEEPLEIRLFFSDGRHQALSITMRTPGHDAELAAGFLFTEGIVKDPKDIKRIAHCGPKLHKRNVSGEPAPARPSNTIRADLADGSEIDLKKLERHFYTTSSCGVCGKSSIEALRADIKAFPDTGFTVRSDVLRRLPSKLREAQPGFDQTGGLHASAFFTTNGQLDILREDVGRHNALDKVIGRKFLDGKIPLADRILLVSGRASFELVQKALMAGILVLAAVGAPSSLAVELAEQYGMTLIGFLREDRFNIYCGGSRIKEL